ncbi:hypothetical protein [Acinetobacter variabilis]|uniref:hypothetical protein n=1 Tax=Acinetobacter variabilis TaxID=70346 RepID=UPI00376F5B1D
MKNMQRQSVCFISDSRENPNNARSTVSIYNSNYSASYVNSVNFSREEMNDAYAKARSQERLSCGGRR